MNNIGFRLRIFLFILFVLLIVGTVGFSITEGLSLLDSLYFSVVTIATVGYGDITPVTPAGRILSLFLIILGVGTFLGVVANATEIFIAGQDKKIRKQKLHMVTSIFFSEAGTSLLKDIINRDSNIQEIRSDLIISNDWTDKHFLHTKKLVQSHNFDININDFDLESMHKFFQEKGDLMLRMLENPSLLEDELFTELMRALVHLREELLYREDLLQLPETDLDHLTLDFKRVYAQLVLQWLEYMHHLQANHPYIFSLAVRTNPFKHKSSPVVT